MHQPATEISSISIVATIDQKPMLATIDTIARAWMSQSSFFPGTQNIDVPAMLDDHDFAYLVARGHLREERQGKPSYQHPHGEPKTPYRTITQMHIRGVPSTLFGAQPEEIAHQLAYDIAKRLYETDRLSLERKLTLLPD